MSMSALPPDVILLICEELGNRHDFASLFNYALSSKRATGPALFWLYRDHTESIFIRDKEDVDEMPEPQNATWEEGARQFRIYTSKWALLWKSVIQSSLGSTAYPYCLYIRNLDFRNLATLLEDPHFRDAIQDSFFADDMTIFRKTTATPKRTRAGKALPPRLVVASILDLIGESVTNFISQAAVKSQTKAALEEISGHINRESLIKWSSRLFRLQSMTLYDAGVLDETVGLTIKKSCPDFNDLTFFGCQGDNVDANMASFLDALQPNSLKSFTSLGSERLGAQTLVALNGHSLSLKRLQLDELSADGIRNISLLQGCQELEYLSLGDKNSGIDLEDTENDIFLEVIAWLCKCSKLKDLTMVNFASAPAILTSVCLSDNIKLEKLKVRNYVLIGSQDFHKAMSNQTTLETIFLRADAEGGTFDDIETLISSLSRLKNLKVLDILEISDYFNSSRISSLAASLPLLEDFRFGGYDATDSIWPAISGLHYLRNLYSVALSSFTSEGLLSYIDTLRPTNRGLVLWAWSQQLTHNLSDAEKSTIKEAIAEKVGGRFEFVLFRETDDVYDSESD